MLFKQQCQGEADSTCQCLSLVLPGSALNSREPNMMTTGHSSRPCLSLLGPEVPLTWQGWACHIWVPCAWGEVINLGQYPGQHRDSHGAHQLHLSPHTPLPAFHGPPVWPTITQTTLPPLQSEQSVLEHRTSSLVSCKDASVLGQRCHFTPSTSGLTCL